MIKDFQFKKHYGQNFLRSEEYLDKFIEVISPNINDLIIEIGPGDGALTKKLLDKMARVIAIEVDSDLITHLNESFDKNFTVINSNVLELDFQSLLETHSHEKNQTLKIVGSLPYNISKPIIRTFFDQLENLKYKQLNFLIQKEVAEDYTIHPPKAKFLYNFARTFGEIKYNFTVPKKYFHPAPKVDGGVITFIPNSYFEGDINKYFSLQTPVEKKEFIKLLKQAYMNPRKTIFNNLKHLSIKEGEYKNIGINQYSRASELDIGTWVKLFEIILNKLKHD